MTLSNKIQEIRKACIAANPEIVELKFGCEVGGGVYLLEYYNDPYVIVGRTWVCEKHRRYRVECEAEEDGCHGEEGFELKVGSEEEDGWNLLTIKKSKLGDILGRPIRLADVLLAIQAKNHGAIYPPEIFAEGHPACYDLLHDDITLQSEEFINLIHSLIA